MENKNKLTARLETQDFVVTAEYLPGAGIDTATLETLKNCGALAVNVADNPDGPIMSSLAASIKLVQSGIEPVYQIVTRDRNRIALQSDILGASSFGISNILCLSGYHQTLTSVPQSANVYDIDSIQLISMITKMNEDGILPDGTKIDEEFSMFVGAVANPYLRPLELNIIRLSKKINAGAKFIQTQAVFDTDMLLEWLEAANKEGLTEKTAIIASVIPLESHAEAENLCKKHTDYYIPESILENMKDAGDEAAQKEAGLNICTEIIAKLKEMKGIKGVHILSGGKEDIIPELISKAGL